MAKQRAYRLLSPILTPFFKRSSIFIGAYTGREDGESVAECEERLKKLAEKVRKATERILPLECRGILDGGVVDGYDYADCFAITFYKLLRKELELNGFKFCSFVMTAGVDADVDMPFIWCDYSVYVVEEDGSVRRVYP